MVYINFPRQDLDNHADLITWRGKAPKTNWGELKIFLTEQARLRDDIHPIPKCWYTELPQGDNYALDVEHFRPKAGAQPLRQKHLDLIEPELGYKLVQKLNVTPYPWLEFEYRNYRITTALPNRGGAKVDYFPLAFASTALIRAQEPWVTQEYNLLLDPTDLHDANLLVVMPNGKIEPRAPKTVMSQLDFINFAANWHSDGFNFLRAVITIVLYRLNDRILVSGRKEVFSDTIEEIKLLLRLLTIPNMNQEITDSYLERLIKKLLPSAPFALAARTALNSYVVEQPNEALLKPIYQTLIATIKLRLDQETQAKIVDWNRP